MPDDGHEAVVAEADRGTRGSAAITRINSALHAVEFVGGAYGRLESGRSVGIGLFVLVEDRLRQRGLVAAAQGVDLVRDQPLGGEPVVVRLQVGPGRTGVAHELADLLPVPVAVRGLGQQFGVFLPDLGGVGKRFGEAGQFRA